MLLKTFPSTSFTNKTIRNFNFVLVNECPMCHHSIQSKIVESVHIQDTLNNFFYITSIEYCPHCERFFLSNRISSYSIPPRGALKCDNARVKCTFPNFFTPRTFPKEISSTFPRFVEIYNQASAAETHELNDLAGMGYRKALEFLVFDYVIKNNPDSKENIIKLTLSQCINNHIDNEVIKDLAVKSAWIGNDQAHYTLKHPDRNINDLKKLLDATVYFISMNLIAEDAKTIPHVR